MKSRAGGLRIDRCVEDVVCDLRGRAYDDDLVLKEGAILIVRLPKLRIENLPQWPWGISVHFSKAQEVSFQVVRNVIGAP